MDSLATKPPLDLKRPSIQLFPFQANHLINHCTSDDGNDLQYNTILCGESVLVNGNMSGTEFNTQQRMLNEMKDLQQLVCVLLL